MLIKPNLIDEEIIKYLQDTYGLNITKISFLPLGADLNTAIYQIQTNSTARYFLKLRRGNFNETAVSIPAYLASLGIKQIIPPLPTKSNLFWASLESFSVILYPYIEGYNGFEVPLSDQQWIEFGGTIKKIHTTNIPSTITNKLPRETFSSKWRDLVKIFLERIENEIFKEPIAEQTALFLKSKSTEFLNIIQRAENLAQSLQKQPLDFTVCHADIHRWNLLIDKKGILYVIDWDTLIYAPKERDLMFIGAGIGTSERTSLAEEKLFYQGYGQTDINKSAIAYYRYERIIEDIGVYCEQIFLSDGENEDKIQSFNYLQSNFLQNGTIEKAYEADKKIIKKQI